MTLLDGIANMEVDDADGRAVPFRDLPDELQVVLAFEALAYGTVADLPFRNRAAVAEQLRNIAAMIESIDPLQYRREHQPAWAAEPTGHA